MQEERRKHPRVMLRWPIAAETEERIVHETTADMSISGACINCHSPLELGEILDLQEVHIDWREEESEK